MSSPAILKPQFPSPIGGVLAEELRRIKDLLDKHLLQYTQTITFDQDAGGQGVTDGTVVDTLYQTLGCTLTFIPTPKGTVLGTHVYARSINSHSAPNSISPVAAPAIITCIDDSWGQMKASFANPVSGVTVYARPMLSPECLGSVTARPYLRAYDAQNNLVSEAFYPLQYGNSSWGTYQPLSVTSSSNNIAYVKFSSEYHDGAQVYALFDDLAFTIKAVPLP